MLYTFYGDDFTGSTDVLEQLATHHIPAVLFLAPPTPAQLAAFPHARAIGIAGDSRSQPPDWMSRNLPGIFRALSELGAPILHYKVCSTFDSSPSSGSIGRALEIGIEAFAPRLVPIAVGAPHLRRYVAFGNLFASDPNGDILRIDRHPMAGHPVTPMREAELLRHLAAQTATPIGLIDLATLNSGGAQSAADSLAAAGCRAIVFDSVGVHTLAVVGEFAWSEAQRAAANHLPLFVIGSSGLTAALIAAWRKHGLLDPLPAESTAPPHHAGSARPLLVVSGSCSVATGRQIEHALAHGFNGIPLDPAALTHPDAKTRLTAQSVAFFRANQSLAAGRDTLLYTALGPVDDAAALPRQSKRLGSVLGSITRDLIAQSAGSPHRVRRIVFCGGDTSSHATRELGIFALTLAANLQPGVPLCRAHADDSAFDGLELVLKGGQVGSQDFFSLVRDAATASR